MNETPQVEPMPTLRRPPKRRRRGSSAVSSTGATLRGEWYVRRVSGLLPPLVTKSIGRDTGTTYWFGVPFGRFDVRGLKLLYRLWPIQDELERWGDSFVGRGLIFGREFCRFRLERR